MTPNQMSFDFKELIEYANTLQVTKRSLPKLPAKVLDPLGLLSSLTITMKCEFQSLCFEKLDWDVKLQGNHRRLWKNFASSLIQQNNVHVPHRYFNSSLPPTDIQIHAFSDVPKTYAAAMYLRSEYEDGHVAVQLLSSKTRVAPIKQTTWYTNLSKTFLQPVEITPREIKQTFWVNSTTVICRTKQGKSWKQYVQNHTPEVHKTVPEAAWNYCPGSKN